MDWFFQPKTQLGFGVALVVLGCLIASDAPRLDSAVPGLILGLAGATCLRNAFQGHRG